MDNKELYKIAQKALENAYAPYSNFKVGAALLASDGTVVTGVNVENSTYGATICAERTAAVKAVSCGNTKFSKIAVASSFGSAWPCGICRQFLYEFNPELIVITGDDENSLEVFQLKELLLKGFRLATE
jgi:cytidine deaminase